LGSLYSGFHDELIEKGKEKIDSFKKLIAERVRKENEGMKEKLKEREDDKKSDYQKRMEVRISEEKLKEWDRNWGKRMEEEEKLKEWERNWGNKYWSELF
jgi:hypothetical protein